MTKIQDFSQFINEAATSSTLGLKDYGYVAGGRKYVKYNNGYLQFHFDFYDPKIDSSQDASFHINVYKGKFVLSIEGRDEFKLEQTYAKNYKSSFARSKFAKKILTIIGESSVVWNYQYGEGDVFSKEIDEKTTIKLHKYLSTVL